MSAPDGLLVVDKPPGWTSHDVVGRARRLAGTRKVGHAGTLDPMATGVLVLGVGRATRLLGHLALTDKAYDATIRLGVTTVTDDAEGEVLEVRDAQCPWNARRWRLTGDLDGATCSPDDGPPDLVLDVGDLGAAYLGGTPLSSRRGTVQERSPGALARTSTAFGPVDRAPWCPMVF